MEEIKLRAWDKGSERMLDVIIINFNDDQVFLSDGFIDGWFSFEEVEIMRYTGLIDKNGKKIYEGDVFFIGNEFRYEDFEAGVFFTYKKNGWQQESLYYFCSTSSVEIVGNIHEKEFNNHVQ